MYQGKFKNKKSDIFIIAILRCLRSHVLTKEYTSDTFLSYFTPSYQDVIVYRAHLWTGFQSCFKPNRWILPLNIHEILSLFIFYLVFGWHTCIVGPFEWCWTIFSEGSAESFLCVHRIFLLHGFQTGQDPVITSVSETWFCQFTICQVRIWLKAIIIIRSQNPLANLINCITAYETPKASFPSGYYCGKTLLWSFPIIL